MLIKVLYKWAHQNPKLKDLNWLFYNKKNQNLHSSSWNVSNWFSRISVNSSVKDEKPSISHSSSGFIFWPGLFFQYKRLLVVVDWFGK
jgi:hypothetical protein